MSYLNIDCVNGFIQEKYTEITSFSLDTVLIYGLRNQWFIALLVNENLPGSLKVN